MKTVKLGDVLLKTSTIKWKDQGSNQTYSYIDLTSVDRSRHEITQTGDITSKNAPSRAQKIVKKDDVIFGTTRPTLNRLCIVPEEYDEQICSTGFCVLRANPEVITSSFIYYLLTTKAFVEYVEVTQRGTSYPAVTDKDVKQFEFVLPSLEEQRKIVGRLDAAFERISAAEVLMRRNLDNVAALQKSILHKYLSASDNTRTHRLGDLVQITIGRTPSRGNMMFWDKDKSEGNVWVSIADMMNLDDKKVNDSKEYVTNLAAESFAIVPEGTLLVSFKLTLGRLAYAGKDLRTNEAIAALHNDERNVLHDYLYYYLDQFDWNTYAAADRKVKGLTLNKAKLAEIPITYPLALDEQSTITKKLNNELGNIRKLETLYQKKLTKLTDLRQSLLAEAFMTTSAV